MIRITLPNYKEETSRKLLGCLGSDVPISLVLPVLENPEGFDVPEFLRTLNILFGSGKLRSIYFNDYIKVIDSFIPYGLLQIAQFRELNMYDLKTGITVREYLVQIANTHYHPQLKDGTYYKNFYNWFDIYQIGSSNSFLRTQFYISGNNSGEVIRSENSYLNYDIYKIFSVDEPFIIGAETLSKKELDLLGEFGKNSITKEDNYYYVTIGNNKIVADGYSNLLKMSKINRNIKPILTCLHEMLYNSRTWGRTISKKVLNKKTYSVGITCQGDHRDLKILMYSQDFGRGISKTYARDYYDKVYHGDDKNIFEIALSDGKTSSYNDILGRYGHGFTRIMKRVKDLDGRLEILSGDVHYVMDELLESKPLGVEESGTLVKVELKLTDF
jgi:hypothetical protein